MKTNSDERMHRHKGWALNTLWLCIVIASFLQPATVEAEALLEIPRKRIQQPQDKFVSIHASAEARAVINWILSSNDHQDLPFAVVDKIHAHAFVFNKVGHFLGDAPVLLGLKRGDDGIEGIGERPLSSIRPEERITPSGRFIASLALNIEGQEILWVNYEQSISMHNLRRAELKERRPERLASPTKLDNRITYGCINISHAFWRDVVRPAFTNQQGLVYVLPEIHSLHAEFGMPIHLQP